MTRPVNWLALPSTIVALSTLAGAVWAAWVRISRRQVRRRLLQLSTGLPLASFEKLLGSPLTMPRRGEGSRVHVVWRSKFAYVLATAPTKDDVVDAYAITVRRKRFKLPLGPFTADQLSGDLRRIHFPAVDAGLVKGRRCIIGANRFGFAESYYFGKPGYYRTYALAYNDAGYGPFVLPDRWQSFASGNLRFEDLDQDELESPSGDSMKLFWRNLGLNTIAVASREAELQYLTTYQGLGVDRAEVEHLPE